VSLLVSQFPAVVDTYSQLSTYSALELNKIVCIYCVIVADRVQGLVRFFYFFPHQEWNSPPA
jgi:hypothetical protein